MRILVIDDDISTVDVILSNIDWERFGADEVYPCYNIASAKKYFENGGVEIAVCDIEMPMGSGLDLLQWAREKGYETQFIFLTSHERFDYANTAIRYRASGYVVKPFHKDMMEEELVKAVQNVQRRSDYEQAVQHEEAFRRAIAYVEASFLRDLFDGQIPSSREAVLLMTVRTAFGTGEVMAVLESESREIPQAEKLIEMFDDAVYSLGCCEDGEPAENGKSYSLESVALIHKGKCHIIAGKPTINEEVITEDGRSLVFEISPQSFYQVNPEQMERLYDKAAEYAGLKGGETVLDLYCGAGTIGLWLLEELRRRDAEAFENTRVIGIESVKPAVIDANRNSVINGVINTRYICGKAEEELPGMMGLAKLYKWNEVNERVEREPEIKLEHADVAVLDPPRAGCAEAAPSRCSPQWCRQHRIASYTYHAIPARLHAISNT